MSDKQESNEKKIGVGILRKRDTTSVVSNDSIRQRIAVYRAKSKIDDSNPPSARSNGGCIFTKKTINRGDKPSTAPPTPRTQIPVPISMRPSTATIDSRLTATTSRSSLSRKPGFIPTFIRNKTGAKHIITTQMQNNKKQFLKIKHELIALQNKVVEHYKRYRDSLVKLNKLNGKDDPPVIEELKIVDFKENCAETPTIPIVSCGEIHLNEKILSDITQQVHGIQGHSFKLLQEFSDRLSSINNQMKLAENSGGGDTNLFPAKIQSFFNDIETKIVEEREHQNSRIINFISDLKHVFAKAGDKSTTSKTEEAESEVKRNDQSKELAETFVKLKTIEVANKQLQQQVENNVQELSARDKSIVELMTSIKVMQEKMARTDEELRSSNELRDENIKLKNAEKALTKEIDCLKHSWTECNKTISKNEGPDKELDRLNTVITELKDELKKRENIVGKRNRRIFEMDGLIKQLETRNTEYQDSISKLEALNNQKSKKIEQIENELHLQEDSLFMQQRLLTIRGELIQSLQENEDSTKNQISALNYEVERGTYTLKQLSQEVSSKSEELEILFSTLGAKNLEVKRQDHIIKLLEETHEKICVTQEAQISRLEKENEKLKRFLIELNVPIQNSCTKSIDEINLRPYKYFYESFRRQKRNAHTLIKVKKYKI